MDEPFPEVPPRNYPQATRQTLGARTRTQLAESLGALSVTLTPEDIARIESAVPADAVAGTRYGEPQMRLLDSER